MNAFSATPNIGKVLAEKLISAGVDSPATIRELGAEKTFSLLQTIDPEACICSLYAIEGAIQDIRWHNLNKERKAELLYFFNSINQNFKTK